MFNNSSLDLTSNKTTTIAIISSINVSDIVVSIILSLISLLTVVSNSIVMIALIYDKKLRKPSNYIIFSLSVADVLTGAILMPMMIILFLAPKSQPCIWIFEIELLFNISSIYHIFCITIDRYLNIVSFRYSVTQSARPVIILIAIAWMVAFSVVFIPRIWGDHIFGQVYDNKNECRIVMSPIYMHIRFTISTYVPFITIIVLNVKIFIVSVYVFI